MRSCFLAFTAVLALVTSSPAFPQARQPASSESALAKIDLEQKDMVARADVAGWRRSLPRD